MQRGRLVRLELRLKRPLLAAGAALAVTAVALSLSVTGGTAGRLSASRASGGNSFAGATIAAPAGFTATATSSTAATLSWTAPARLTGYTLSQSPGTLAGCSAAPSAATTTCSATGLSPRTAYTWTLAAVYNNWKSSSVSASATSLGVGASLLGKVTDSTGGSQSSTVTSVTTTSGADLLILVYRQTTNSAPAISSVSGTAISGTPASVNFQAFGSPSRSELWAYRATGTGTAGGTVTVTFTSANNATTEIDVVQLSGDKAGSPVAQSAVTTGSGAAATGGALAGASAADGEIFFTGLITAATMSTPGGYSALDAPASGVHGAWFSSAASSAAISTTLGTTSTYATIEVEVAHG